MGEGSREFCEIDTRDGVCLTMWSQLRDLNSHKEKGAYKNHEGIKGTESG